MQEKTCYTCKFIKDVSEFHRDKNTLSGYSSNCKDCVSRKAGRKRQPQIHFEDGTRLCTKCRERFPETIEYFHFDKKGRSNSHCRKCVRDANAIYNAANIELKRARGREYVAKTKDKRKGYNQEYYKNNQSVIKNRVKQWATDNPEKARAHSRATQLRRRVILATQEKLTPELIQEMYELQGGRCLYCDIALFDNYHVDHIIPVALGGGNDFDNLCIACPFCNQSKSDKLLTEWEEVRGW